MPKQLDQYPLGHLDYPSPWSRGTPDPVGAVLWRSASSGRVPPQGHVCRPPGAVRSRPAQGQASVMHKCAVPLMFEQ